MTMNHTMTATTYKENAALVPDFPNIVNVEVYRGSCPCRCVHCPVGVTPPSQRKQVFGEGGIELPLFKKIATEIAAHTTPVLRIHSTGEPLLWEDLPGALDVLRETGVKSWLFTSAVTTNKSLLRAICEAVSIVEVSVNSTTREDYLATKGVDAFALVEGNIRYMRSIIQRNAPLRLIVSRVESGNKELDCEFIQTWKSSALVDDAFVRSRHTYNDLLPGSACDPAPVAKTGPCLVHWARFNIGLDGRAVVCFNELFKEEVHPSLVLGDVWTESIAEIWKGSRLSAIRRAELTGDYSALPTPEALPCKNCSYCQPLFNKKRQTSEYQIEQAG